MSAPVTPARLSSLAAALPEARREDVLAEYGERAALVEYEAKVPREEAERLAADMVARRHALGPYAPRQHTLGLGG